MSLGAQAIIGVVGIYYQRQQLRQMTVAELGISSRPFRALHYWPLIVMVLCGLVAWVPWIVSQYSESSLQGLRWGVYSATVDQNHHATEITVYVTADRSNTSKHAPTDRMMAVAFHYYGDKDIDDASNLQKSAIYDVRSGTQTMLIKVNQQFLDEVNRGTHRTNYFLLMFPQGMTSDFITLRQAKAMGAKIEIYGYGPP